MTLYEIKTDPKLLAALKQAGTRELTPTEVRAQRVSFIYGSLSDKSSVTRAHIEEVLDKQEGRVVA